MKATPEVRHAVGAVVVTWMNKMAMTKQKNEREKCFQQRTQCVQRPRRKGIKEIIMSRVWLEHSSRGEGARDEPRGMSKASISQARESEFY